MSIFSEWAVTKIILEASCRTHLRIAHNLIVKPKVSLSPREEIEGKLENDLIDASCSSTLDSFQYKSHGMDVGFDVFAWMKCLKAIHPTCPNGSKARRHLSCWYKQTWHKFDRVLESQSEYTIKMLNTPWERFHRTQDVSSISMIGHFCIQVIVKSSKADITHAKILYLAVVCELLSTTALVGIVAGPTSIISLTSKVVCRDAHECASLDVTFTTRCLTQLQTQGVENNKYPKSLGFFQKLAVLFISDFSRFLRR
jgi:hypothetical protein